MLSIIRSFLEKMRAKVSVKDLTTDKIEVMKGLRQGRTMASTLFNVYYSAVVASWRNHCLFAGVDVKFRHGRKLVGDCTAISRLSKVTVFESQFSDDTAIYTTERDAFVCATTVFALTAKYWGMTVVFIRPREWLLGATSLAKI